MLLPMILFLVGVWRIGTGALQGGQALRDIADELHGPDGHKSFVEALLLMSGHHGGASGGKPQESPALQHAVRENDAMQASPARSAAPQRAASEPLSLTNALLLVAVVVALALGVAWAFGGFS